VTSTEHKQWRLSGIWSSRPRQGTLELYLDKFLEDCVRVEGEKMGNEHRFGRGGDMRNDGNSKVKTEKDEDDGGLAGRARKRYIGLFFTSSRATQSHRCRPMNKAGPSGSERMDTTQSSTKGTQSAQKNGSDFSRAASNGWHRVAREWLSRRVINPGYSLEEFRSKLSRLHL
jgi:hypothetical protein